MCVRGLVLCYIYIFIYDPLNNFCKLSLDKIDHVIQSEDGYQKISAVWFYFDGIKAKKRVSVQAKLFMESRSIIFAEAIDGEINKLVHNSAQSNNSIHCTVSACVYLKTKHSQQSLTPQISR